MQEQKLKILLTNDDGYTADGINILYDFLKDDYDVKVVAPKEHQSGKSASIHIHLDSRLTEVKKNFYYLDGSPADCVRYGLMAFKDTDLVISGCNHGFNISCYTLYSGTLGAALQAMMLGYSSIAFSAEGELVNLKEHFHDVFDLIMERKLYDASYTLNVNFPLTKEVKGVKVATLASYPELLNFFYKKDHQVYPHEEFTEKVENWFGLPIKEDVIKDMKKHLAAPDLSTDTSLLLDGYITITPLVPPTIEMKGFKVLEEKLK